MVIGEQDYYVDVVDFDTGVTDLTMRKIRVAIDARHGEWDVVKALALEGVFVSGGAKNVYIKHIENGAVHKWSYLGVQVWPGGTLTYNEERGRSYFTYEGFPSSHTPEVEAFRKLGLTDGG